MHALRKITETEARLLAREPIALFFSLVFPTLLLVVLGLIPALREPSEDMGGISFIEFFAPSLVVFTLGMVSLQVVPNALAAYREQGVLRRLAVTPAHPRMILIAHLVVNFVTAVISTVLVMAVGRIAFGIPLPHFALGFVAAFALGITALFAVGLIIAAVAPSSRAAGGMGTFAFTVAMFFGGVYVPRFVLPESIARIGAYIPPSVQALQDGWTGAAPPQALHLFIMAGIALVATAVAARLFRWE
jgi:ABC-2 type transport system permease protein